MLVTEWDWNTALEVHKQEVAEEALQKGRQEGIEIGMEKTARNALAKGFSPEQVCDITGLGMEAVKNLQKQEPI
jgi:predicted transposase/invertase (TIGR01784 family)